MAAPASVSQHFTVSVRNDRIYVQFEVYRFSSKSLGVHFSNSNYLNNSTYLNTHFMKAAEP